MGMCTETGAAPFSVQAYDTLFFCRLCELFLNFLRKIFKGICYKKKVNNIKADKRKDERI